MKYRCDFVTNSSSSSFLLAFSSQEDGISQIKAMDVRLDAIVTLLEDFLAATPIPKDKIIEHFQDNLDSEVSFSLDWNPCNYGDSEFKKAWMKDHPGAKWSDYRRSSERAAKLQQLIASRCEDLLSDIADRDYLVEVEYEDHTSLGSDLEHEILPYQDFTVRRFSHH